MVLPLLFEGIDPETPIIVLDLGAATAETVRYFSEYRCHICFADLMDQPELRGADPETAQRCFDRLFRDLLRNREDLGFDLCLFWDLLDTMDGATLFAFAAALQPYVHRETRAHGFATFSRSRPVPIRRYGIVSTDTLDVRDQEGTYAPERVHSRARLSEAFDYFQFARGTLLKDGRTEFLLKAW
jgi:hypothetical protein